MERMKGSLPSLSQKSPTSSIDNWSKNVPTPEMSAMRQLSNLHRKGRKSRRLLLPGGKLKPLYKNRGSSPSLSQSPGTLSRNMSLDRQDSKVLPNIGQYRNHGERDSSSSSSSRDGLTDSSSSDRVNSTSCSTSTVRIYLISNYTDMKAERNLIKNIVYPRLQKFCSKLGLDFQIVDLNWAADYNEAIKAQRYTMKEIHKCQQNSIGPCIMALIGDHYGEPQLPLEIGADVFSMMQDVMKEKNLGSENIMEKIYKQMDGSTTDAFLLQTNLGDASDADIQQLLRALETSARICIREGRQTQEAMAPFVISGLEKEISEGILNLPDPQRQALIYKRTIKDIHTSSLEHLQDYTPVKKEIDGWEIDKESQEKLKRLMECLETHMGEKDITNFQTNLEGNCEINSVDHEEYLNNLANTMEKDLKALIHENYSHHTKPDRRLPKYRDDCLPERQLHKEIFRELANCFVGRDALLTQIERYLTDPRQNYHPLVMCGPTGSGKSALLGKAEEMCQKWFSRKCTTVVRVIGRTTSSSSLHPLIKNIILDICDQYGLPDPVIKNMDTLLKALKCFQDTIGVVSVQFASKRPLLIFLDGLDKLSMPREAVRALVVAKDLPPGIHMVISLLSENDNGTAGIIPVLEKYLPTVDCILQIGPLAKEDIEKMISMSGFSWRKERLVTDCEHVPNPFFVELQMTLAKAGLDIRNNGDIKSAILKYVDLVEKRLGMHLVKYALSYVLVSSYGVSETELEGLLSINDKVMAEVFSSSGPPLGGVVGIPSHLLCSLLDQLEPLLMKCQFHQKNVYKILNSTTRDTLSTRYSVVYPGMAEPILTEEAYEFTTDLHKDFATMFLNKDTYTKDLVLKQVTISKSERMVHQQSTSPHNVRKLQCLPGHLRVLLAVPGYGLDKIISEVLCSFDWILCKLQSCCVEDVLCDYELTLGTIDQLNSVTDAEEMISRSEIELVWTALRESKRHLEENPSAIAVQLLSRLLPTPDQAAVMTLLDDARSWLEKQDSPVLVPVYAFSYSSGAFLASVHRISGRPSEILIKGNGHLAVLNTHSGLIYIVDLKQGEIVSQTPGLSPVGKSIVGHTGEFIVMCCPEPNSSDTMLKVWSTSLGIEVFSTVFQYKFDILALSSDDKTLLLQTTVDQLKKAYGSDLPGDLPSDGKSAIILGIDVKSTDVMFTLSGQQLTKCAHVHFLPNLSSVLYLVAQSSDSTYLYMHDVNTNKLRAKMQLDANINIFKVADGISFAVAANKSANTLFVANLLTYDIQQLHLNSGKSIVDIVLSEYNTFAASLSGEIYTIDLATCAMKKIIGIPDIGADVSTTFMVISQDCSLLFVGLSNGCICAVTCEGILLQRIVYDNQAVASMCCSSEGWLLAASDDGLLKCWNIERLGRNLEDKTSSSHKDQDIYLSDDENITCTEISSDGKMFVTASANQGVKIWDVATGKLEKHITSATNESISNIKLGKQDKTLIMQKTKDDEDGTKQTVLEVYEIAEGKCRTLPCQLYKGTSYAVNGTGDRLLAVSHNHLALRASLIDVDGLTSLCSSDLPISVKTVMDHKVSQLQFNSAGNRTLLCLWSKSAGTFLYTITVSDNDELEIHPTPIVCDAEKDSCIKMISDDLIAVGKTCGVVELYNVSDGSLRSSHQVKAPDFFSLDASPPRADPVNEAVTAVCAKNKYLAVAFSYGHVNVWTNSMETKIAAFSALKEKVCCLDIAGDGSMLMCGSEDRSITVWQIPAGTLMSKIQTDFIPLQAHLIENTHGVYILVKVREVSPKVVLLKLLT